MNQKSLEKTLKRKAIIEIVQLPGYKRVFNAPFGEYAFLNLQKSAGSTIEVGYFDINSSELTLFSERERGSSLLKVAGGCFAFVWPITRCKELPVLKSYIKVCEEGARKIGVDLWQGADRPKQVIDDDSNPQY